MQAAFTVPNEQEWIIERWRRFWFIAEPGLNLILPIGARIREEHLMAEQELPLFVEPTEFDFADGSSGVPIDMKAFVKVVDPKKATYKVRDWKKAVASLVETRLGDALTKMPEEEARASRAKVLGALDQAVLTELRKDLAAWGIKLVRVTLKDIKLSKRILDSRAALFDKDIEEKMAEKESKIRAHKGVGTYVASRALLEGADFKDSRISQKEKRNIALGLTRDGMKLAAGALTQRNIYVQGGTTIEGAFDVLGSALAGRGSGGRDPDINSKPQDEEDKNRWGLENFDAMEKWLDDVAEGRV